jgi:Rad3-related DNA helicase
MKICAKNNCSNNAIQRGKYCIIHKTNKKKIIIDDEGDKKENIVSQHFLKNNTDYDIERILKEEQDEEYKKTMEMDIERIRLKNEEDEIKNIIELSKQMYIQDKKNKIKEEPNESKDNYNFQFKLPNNNRIKRIFDKDSTLIDIRNFLDIYFYENSLNIENYDLVTFPKIIFKKNDDKKISEYNLQKNILFFIHNLDS